MTVEGKRTLDIESTRLINEMNLTPQSKKTPLKVLYFDVAIQFSKTYQYRIMCFLFEERRFVLLRHNIVKEEYFFTQVSNVSMGDTLQPQVTVLSLTGNVSTLEIVTQSSNDAIQIFQIFYQLSLTPRSKFYNEDFGQDTVKVKMEVPCCRNTNNLWSPRKLVIYNGKFVLYKEGESKPANICPFSARLKFETHVGAILQIDSVIRSYILKFESEEKMKQVVETFNTCFQFTRPQIRLKTRNFTSGKLGLLTTSSREICVKNLLDPDECNEHFFDLMEILKALLKGRKVLEKVRPDIAQEEERRNQMRIGQIQQDFREDDPLIYCEQGNPTDLYTNFVSVGKGGFGEVFKVLSKNGNQAFAVKELKHTITQRASKIGIEISRMSIWNHKNLIKLEKCLMFKGKIYIVMDYCTNGSLKMLIKERGPLELDIIAFLLRGIVEGVRYIHEQGFIHRDIKTANLMLDSNNELKIIDFGLVIRNSALPHNRAGSKSYMAPEVIKQILYNEKVDVWSIGCVAQELLETQPPYKEHGIVKGMFKTVIYGAQGLRDVRKATPQFLEFMEKCFVYDYTKRASCEELLKVCFLLISVINHK
ncbi:serine/threonine protein kinase, putative [Entamoeba invadens IP1]|uniref:Serine/threonine protein kinase, putative n=1 Tax=Entamoeba invadens IP1 TaxID=370355 RepID=A0A0A1UG27_ENTIV|nr:serine/threonine protein kinase, putative [Entamoeba invadens IP1]ELP92174.1 serine/threonine protein kinase, putative [Entamoeba invadens IP1]|eukprot:XP_004258945.1 serine/threonine protein kinase, putative [Entamoeba invadens IP1]